MAGGLAIAAEDAGKHPVFRPDLPYLRNFPAARPNCIELGRVDAGLANVDSVLKIEFGKQGLADVACIKGR